MSGLLKNAIWAPSENDILAEREWVKAQINEIGEETC